MDQVVKNPGHVALGRKEARMRVRRGGRTAPAERVSGIREIKNREPWADEQEGFLGKVGKGIVRRMLEAGGSKNPNVLRDISVKKRCLATERRDA